MNEIADTRINFSKISKISSSKCIYLRDDLRKYGFCAMPNEIECQYRKFYIWKTDAKDVNNEKNSSLCELPSKYLRFVKVKMFIPNDFN